jgi:4-carboxymuconolactone decarboxylase
MPDESTQTPVLDLLASMTAESLERSTLDAESVLIARIAALVAVDAPPVSYLVNLGAAAEAGVDAETVQGVLIAVAPIVGTARVASAAGKIARALGLAIAIAEADLEESDADSS